MGGVCVWMCVFTADTSVLTVRTLSHRLNAHTKAFIVLLVHKEPLESCICTMQFAMVLDH